MKDKSLPTIKIDSRTLENMKIALAKFNDQQLLPISLSEFRRLAYEYLCQEIFNDPKLSNIKLSRKL